MSCKLVLRMPSQSSFTTTEFHDQYAMPKDTASKLKTDFSIYHLWVLAYCFPGRTAGVVHLTSNPITATFLRVKIDPWKQRDVKKRPPDW